VSIFEKPPEAWNESDLRELLGPPPQRETSTLEFKGQLALSTGGDKRKAERAVHGLANRGEGVLIFGVSEQELHDGSKVAGDLTPVAGGLAEQLNNVLDACGDPRAPFDLHVIDSEEGGVYLAVVVYGHRRPHMSSDGRYYMRRNLQVRRMTEAEVAEEYRDRLLREHRATERLLGDLAGTEEAASALAAVDERVHRGLTEAELAQYFEQTGEQTPPGWLSVFTHPVPLQPNLIDPARTRPEIVYGIDMEDRWRRIEGTLDHYRLRPHLQGFFAQLPERDDTYPRYLLRLWRDGLLEFGDLLEPPFRSADPIENRVIPTHAVAQYVHDFLLLFARLYAVLGYEEQVRAVARLDHVRDYRLGLDPNRIWFHQPIVRDDEITADEWVGPAEDLEGAAGSLARDLSQRLFLSAGLTDVYFFDQEGNYTP